MNALPQNPLTGIRAVIVDLDGTMVHTAPDFQFAINRMRAELDLGPLTIEMITLFVGKGTEHLVKRSLEVDLAPERADECFIQALDSYKRHYLSVNGQYASLYAEVEEGLASMQAQGLRMACVTNKPLGFALPLLDQMNLHRYFEIVYGGDSFDRKKPDPYPLLQVCRDFNLQPEQVVAIGDSSNDSEAARAAGCRVLNVSYGYNHGRPIQEVDSDGIVDTLLQAAHLISK